MCGVLVPGSVFRKAKSHESVSKPLTVASRQRVSFAIVVDTSTAIFTGHMSE